MSRIVGATLVALFLTPPCLAMASAMPEPDPRQEEEARVHATLGWVLVEGEGRVSDPHVEVSCAEVDLGLVVRAVSCRLRASFALFSYGEVSVRRASAHDGFRGDVPQGIEVMGERLGDAPRRFGPGMSVTVRIDHSFDLSTSTSIEDDFVMRPNVSRHLVMGESGGLRRHDARFDAPLVAGRGLAVDSEIELRAEPPTHVSVDASVGAPGSPRLRVAIALAAPDYDEGIFQNGGVVLELGARAPRWEADTEDFFVAVGYEVALYEYFYVRAMVETDFTSLYQSLLLEAASPHLLFLIPSLNVGLGAVLAERADGRVEGALRVRVGAQILPFFVVGLGASFDYWPAADEWSATLAARVSI